MPQQRQRIVFCDCLDCVEQPRTTDIASSTSPANEAAARQEPPPKCLVVVLSGVLLPRRPNGQQPDDPNASSMDTVLDACNLPHLHRATALGDLCLLTLRADSPADSCSELAQLLNAYEEHQQGTKPASVAERFKGMVSSFASNSSTARQLAASVGMSSSTVLDPDSSTPGGEAAVAAAATAAAPGIVRQQGASDEAAAAAFAGLMGASRAAAGGSGHGGGAGGAAGASAAAAAAAAAVVEQQLPDPAEAARRILEQLGLQQADAGLDLLMVHIDAPALQQQQPPGQDAPAAAAGVAAAAVLAWADRTLRYLNNSSAFRDAVLLTLLATPGDSSLPAPPPPLLAAAGGQALHPGLLVRAAAAAGAEHQSKEQQQQRCVLRPLQSWEQLGGKPLAVSRTRPMLCLRRLPGVVRRDGCARFSLRECCRASGSLGLLADRLLPEIAYKLGRAPKYGA